MYEDVLSVVELLGVVEIAEIEGEVVVAFGEGGY